MKKHMKLVGIFGGVAIIILLAMWAGWSLDIYKTANKYAAELTKSWQEQTNIEREFKKLEETKEGYMRSWLDATTEVQMWASALVYKDFEKENVKKSLITALVKDPEYFDFKGDKGDTKAVQEWAIARVNNRLENLGDRLGGIFEELEKTAAAAPVPTTPVAPTAPAPAPVTSAAPTAPVTPTPAPPAAPLAPTPTPPVSPAPAAAPTAPDKFKLATVGKGEGIEHAFIRQLVTDPSIVEGVKVKVLGKVYDLTYKGEKSNAKELKKWAGWAADLIAQNQGYVNFATGREIRVKSPNEIAYLLDKKDSNVVVGEIVLEGNKVADAKESNSEKENSFEGDISDGVQNYEYIYTPSAQTAQTSSNTNTVSNSSPHQISANLFVSGLQIDFIGGTESLC